MARKKIEPVNAESDFQVHELFFSQTDKKGIISFGNDVFTRVSGYDLGEMINKPHNIIRHPDMPKAVFKLLWNRALAGHPVAAYVKNLASNGFYYWVLAVVSPYNGDLVSVRLKPTSGICDLVAKIYAKTREYERTHSIDESVKFMLSEIASVGFPTYEEFEAEVLRREIGSRFELMKSRVSAAGKDELVRKDGDTDIQSFFSRINRICMAATTDFQQMLKITGKLIASRGELKRDCQAILVSCKALGNMVVNMAITAEKIGQSAKTLAEIAVGFEKFANDVQGAVNLIDKSMVDADVSIVQCQFLVASSCLQIEMVRFYVTELQAVHQRADDIAMNYDQGMGVLASFIETAKFNIEQTSLNLGALVNTAVRFSGEIEAMEYAISGLEVIRLSGNVESSSAPGGEAFGHHIGDMMDFITKFKGPLENIRNQVVDFEQSVANARRLFRRIERDYILLYTLFVKSSFYKSALESRLKKLG
jgi:aerotaxis receptor